MCKPHGLYSIDSVRRTEKMASSVGLSFDPIAFFATELAVLNLDVRVAAMQNVVILARAIGPEDTLKRLLPFLTNIIPETSEEVLVALAKRIAEVVRLSSATQTLDPTAVQLFINCFTELSAFTAPHIHNALSISIEHFLSYYTGDMAPIITHILSTLAISQYSPQREFSVMSIPYLYQYIKKSNMANAGQVLNHVLTIFSDRVQDADSVVRRVGAHSLRKFIELTIEQKESDEHIQKLSFLFRCYERLALDAIDHVRAVNVINGLLLLKLAVLIKGQSSTNQSLQKEARDLKEVLPALIKTVSRATTDRHWLVRKNTAEIMPLFFAQMHKKLDTSDCAVMYRLLSEDNEPEIRALTLSLAPSVIPYLDASSLQKSMLPALAQRITDSDTATRCSLADHCIYPVTKAIQEKGLQPEELKNLMATICDMALKLSMDANIDVHSHALVALTDAYLDSTVDYRLQEVAAKIIHNHCKMTNTEIQWRTRLTLIESVERLVQVKHPNIYNHILTNFPIWLQDTSDLVRDRTATLLSLMFLAYGLNKFTSDILPRFQQYINSNMASWQDCCLIAKCLVRILGAYIVESLDSDPSTQTIMGYLKNSKMCTAKHTICKEVFNLTRILAKANQSFSQRTGEFLSSLLHTLAGDGDTEDSRLAREVGNTVQNMTLR
eukprot:XP_001706604.1 Protein phosphatase PP2A regulatory subunit A [Giardia lamblia ATCC 50803]